MKNPSNRCDLKGLPTFDVFKVGVTGFEPATPRTPCEYSTGLSHTPNGIPQMGVPDLEVQS